MLGERSLLLFKMRCFIINTKLVVQKNTPILIPLIIFSFYLFVSISTTWIEASTLICELMREKSEGEI